MADRNALTIANEYARIVRGEQPGWEGDRVVNGESFAWRIGYDFPGDAPELLQALADSADEISAATGLPASSVQRLAARIRRGMKEALAQAKADSR